MQTLARHSDPRLTMKVYTHLTAFDLYGAVADPARLDDRGRREHRGRNGNRRPKCYCRCYR